MKRSEKRETNERSGSTILMKETQRISQDLILTHLPFVSWSRFTGVKSWYIGSSVRE